MTSSTDIFTRYAPEYLEKYPNLPEAHRKVIEAILDCRTGECVSTVYQCQSSGQMHTGHCSCSNRRCPQCQHPKTRGWLEKQLARELPEPHFLITFAVPKELRDFIRSHRKSVTKPYSRLPRKPSSSWPKT